MISKISWKPVGFGIFLGILITYLLMVALFAFIGPAESFNAALIDPSATFTYIYGDENLSTAFIILPFIIIAATLHVLRYSILKHSYEDASDLGIHGTAKWGTPVEFTDGKMLSKNNKYGNIPEDTLQVEQGIILGKIPKKKKLLIMGENTDIDNRNVLVIGSSGSGKGQGFVIPNLINMREQTIIVTDPKGELYDQTATIKRDQGYDVFHIDFVTLLSAKYNPLDYVRNDFDAIKLAGTISRNSSKDTKEDFFFNTAKDLLTGIIIYVKGKKSNATFTDVKNTFNQINEDEEYLKELCEEIGHEHPAYQYLKDASTQSGNTRASILSSFAQQTAIFSLQDVANMTAQSDFNIYDFQKRKSILYIRIPMKTNPVQPLTATFFDQLIDTFYEIAGNEKNRMLPIHTTFLLDEFANIGRLNGYDETLSTCRGQGMSMQTIIQDFAQIEKKDMYGHEQARTIINNHDSTLFLRTKDTKTAEYFSKLAGDTTVKHTTGSKQHGTLTKDGSYSSSEQVVKRPLITPGELSNNKGTAAYLFIAGYDPLKVEKAFQSNIYGDYVNDYDKYRNEDMKEKDRQEEASEAFQQEEMVQETQEESGVSQSNQSDGDIELSDSELTKLLQNDTGIVDEEDNLEAIQEQTKEIETSLDQDKEITKDDEKAIKDLVVELSAHDEEKDEETMTDEDHATNEDQNDNRKKAVTLSTNNTEDKKDSNITPDEDINAIEDEMKNIENHLIEDEPFRKRKKGDEEELPM
ncbi:type IV secretion system protein VirD4 [Geomicrobium halophilum]|uniref:Type IV secretion system protein VirD4 n=1 Tax=Geomicrobium halophilum TaxID=549000 RepID=A0A841PLW2_9BACL|nr:type IV secretory system conjugative DNA transfer family protein [Geomicrobium halophilum]MBB6449739.1 type IV secretion system protein VirD4 [Geomicrobium halophilum]